MQKVAQLFRFRPFITQKPFIRTCIPFLLLFLFSTRALSQDFQHGKVNLDLHDAPLKQALAEIQQQSGIRFVYDQDINKYASLKITHTENGMPVKKATELVLKGTNLKYTVEGSHVMISERTEAAPQHPNTPASHGSGTVKGRIVEFETAQPLPGASIMIAALGKGITSDNNGYYKLTALPPGKYDLQVTYIGFRTETVSVEIREGKEAAYDVKLQGNNKLGEVVIKSRQARLKTAVAYTSDKELLTEIRDSRSVVSGISNEQISRSADRNAAEIVRRIPGVTVTDDRFIVVRGMNQRYNITYLNGNLAPATELYSRAFAYDLLPSPIIDRILVYKSPSPDLLGDFAGGAVKVFTKNAREVRHLDIGIQGGYREGLGFRDINSYKGGKLDWLGFDDGGRKLPGMVSGYTESGGHKQYDQQQLVKAFNPELQTGRTHYAMDFQAFFNYYDKFKLGKGKVYNLTSITYTNETKPQDIYRQTGNTYQADEYNTNFGTSNKIINEQQTTEIGKLNAMQNFTYKLDENNQFEFNNFFLNEGRKVTDIRVTQDNIGPFWTNGGLGMAKKSDLLSFQQRLLYTGNLDGHHRFNKQEVQWNLGYTYSKQDIPDQRVSSFYAQDNHVPDDPTQWYAGGSNLGFYKDLFLGMVSRLFVKNTENLYNFSADYKLKLSRNFDLKAGTYNLFRYREVSRRFFKVNRAGLTGHEYDFSLDPLAIRDGFGYNDPKLINFTEADLANVWSTGYFPKDGTGLAIYDVTSPVDAYKASEQNNSGYIMGEYRALNDRLIVSGGLRAEYDLQKIAGALNGDVIIPVLIRKEKMAWLPSLNVSYTIDSSMVIRGGYGKTVNRPELREISPFNDFDFVNNEFIAGNPNVVTADITNYDLRLELYPKKHPNETVSIGAFYKNLLHPIERVRQEATNGSLGDFPLIGFNNADKAKVYGLEAEVRKSLSFIPGKFFRNLSVQVNGALIKSSVRQDSISDNSLVGSFRVGRFRDRQLQGQAPYVVNLGLYYENPSWGTKISVSYNVNGPTIYAVSSKNKYADPTPDSITYKGTRPSLLELPRRQLDISLTQRLFKTMQVKLNIQNVLNQPFRIAEDQNENNKYDREIMYPSPAGKGRTFGQGDNIYLQYNPRRYYTLTFTYSF